MVSPRDATILDQKCIVETDGKLKACVSSQKQVKHCDCWLCIADSSNWVQFLEKGCIFLMPYTDFK